MVSYGTIPTSHQLQTITKWHFGGNFRTQWVAQRPVSDNGSIRLLGGCSRDTCDRPWLWGWLHPQEWVLVWLWLKAPCRGIHGPFFAFVTHSVTQTGGQSKLGQSTIWKKSPDLIPAWPEYFESLCWWWEANFLFVKMYMTFFLFKMKIALLSLQSRLCTKNVKSIGAVLADTSGHIWEQHVSVDLKPAHASPLSLGWRPEWTHVRPSPPALTPLFPSALGYCQSWSQGEFVPFKVASKGYLSISWWALVWVLHFEPPFPMLMNLRLLSWAGLKSPFLANFLDEPIARVMLHSDGSCTRSLTGVSGKFPLCIFPPNVCATPELKSLEKQEGWSCW